VFSTSNRPEVSSNTVKAVEIRSDLIRVVKGDSHDDVLRKIPHDQTNNLGGEMWRYLPYVAMEHCERAKTSVLGLAWSMAGIALVLL
jgi:hypothetical protein